MINLLPWILARLPRSWIEATSRSRWRHPSVDRCVNLVAGLLRDRDSYIQDGAGRGLRFNPGRAAASYVVGTAEPETQLVLTTLLRPGMTFYDIGANVGFYSVIAARLVGGAGRVVSFEPLPENTASLKHNAEINNFGQVTVHEFALGCIDGEMLFAMSERPTWGKLSSVGTLPNRHIGNVKVAVHRLDSIVNEAALRPPDLVKIDVEGAENDVLGGARDTLARHRPVLIIELHGTNDLVVRTLAPMGYCAMTLYPYPSIGEAYWNAGIVAVPSERPELLLRVIGDRMRLTLSSNVSAAAA
jgi:FkbM family methyltransferase